MPKKLEVWTKVKKRKKCKAKWTGACSMQVVGVGHFFYPSFWVSGRKRLASATLRFEDSVSPLSSYPGYAVASSLIDRLQHITYITTCCQITKNIKPNGTMDPNLWRYVFPFSSNTFPFVYYLFINLLTFLVGRLTLSRGKLSCRSNR